MNGSPFALSLDAQLLAAGWHRQQRFGQWSHPSGCCVVALLTGKCVKATRPGRAGQKLLTSRIDDAENAALDVAAQAVTYARLLMTEYANTYGGDDVP